MARTESLLLLAVLLCGLAPADPSFATEEAGAASPASSPDRILAIEVDGNDMILASTVTHFMATKVGASFSAPRLREDIRTLYDKEFFDDIQMYAVPEEQGVRLIVQVVEKPRIRRIDYIGAKKLKIDKLEELTALRVNGLLRQSLIEQTIRQIREKYLEDGFNYAQVEVVPRYIDDRNVVAEVRLEENAKVKIRSVTFEGNEVFRDAKLRKQMENNKRRWYKRGKYKPDLLPQDIELIHEFYEDNGYLRAKIGEPEITIFDPRQEKRERKEERLREKQLRQYRRWSERTADLPAEQREKQEEKRREKFEEQLAKQREKFAKRKAKRRVDMVIPLEEGSPYTISDIAIGGNILFDEEALTHAYRSVRMGSMFSTSVFRRQKIRVRPGVVYSKTAVDKAIEAMKSLYSSRGYIYSNVFPVRHLDDANLTVAVNFEVVEGDQAWLRRVEFSGNHRTRDKVLRRQLLIREGDVFNLNSFRSSIERIFYLGYIENPEPLVDPDPDDPTQVDVTVKLNDERRTELQVSGGYSSVDEFVFSGSVTEHNLFGYGQELSLSLTLGRIRQTYSISFTDPYFMDTNFYLSGSIFNTLRAYDKYDRRSTGGSLFTGYNLTPFSYIRLGYRYERVKVGDLSRFLYTKRNEEPHNLTSTERLILDAAGSSITSSVIFTVAQDKRNNRRDPTRGTYLGLTSEYAGGLLGGTNTYYKWRFEATGYMPLFAETYFAAHLEFRYADSFGNNKLPVFEYYHLGGENSVRGTEYDAFGPLDWNLETLGGNKSLQINFEYVIPLAGPLKLVTFFDTGDVWGPVDIRREVDGAIVRSLYNEPIDPRTMRSTAGLELRFLVPQFWVPIRFIWGYNLQAYDKLEDRSSFQFAIGTIF
jgi:outer membrane protein insertion porin family